MPPHHATHKLSRSSPCSQGVQRARCHGCRTADQQRTPADDFELRHEAHRTHTMYGTPSTRVQQCRSILYVHQDCKQWTSCFIIRAATYAHLPRQCYPPPHLPLPFLRTPGHACQQPTSMKLETCSRNKANDVLLHPCRRCNLQHAAMRAVLLYLQHAAKQQCNTRPCNPATSSCSSRSFLQRRPANSCCYLLLPLRLPRLPPAPISPSAPNVITSTSSSLTGSSRCRPRQPNPHPPPPLQHFPHPIRLQITTKAATIDNTPTTTDMTVATISSVDSREPPLPPPSPSPPPSRLPLAAPLLPDPTGLPTPPTLLPAGDSGSSTMLPPPASLESPRGGGGAGGGGGGGGDTPPPDDVVSWAGGGGSGWGGDGARVLLLLLPADGGDGVPPA